MAKRKKLCKTQITNLSKLENIASTATVTTDILPLTNDEKFKTNFRFIEVGKHGSTFHLNYYRVDGNTLDQDRYIINKDKEIIKLKPGSEHHLNKPPARICEAVDCGSCAPITAEKESQSAVLGLGTLGNMRLGSIVEDFTPPCMEKKKEKKK
ncbi:hypothetical protein KY361_05255 [Candidatus Woesearchaeota archaeon]|nr:hypothetical protein [Candidatus Woesearchaeota archaeon]